MKFVRLLIVLAMLAGLAFTAAPTASAAGSVRIAKIYFNSPGSDGGSNTSLNAEYIVIKNYSSKDRSLTNWTIRDAAGHVFKFPGFVLKAGYSVTVHTGSGTNTSKHRYWGSGWYIWNNTGDKARLKHFNGTLMDSCTYSGSGSYTTC